jgi:hypothetical protein
MAIDGSVVQQTRFFLPKSDFAPIVTKRLVIRPKTNVPAYPYRHSAHAAMWTIPCGLR